MHKLISAFLSGLIVAIIFIILRPKLGGWAIVIAVVSFPVIFWLAQAVIDILCQLLKGK